MGVAETTVSESAGPQSWATICERHPNAWVCLHDVETAPDGAIRSARVIGQAPSMRHLLAQVGVPLSETVVVHTAGRPTRTPRIELTDDGASSWSESQRAEPFVRGSRRAR